MKKALRIVGFVFASAILLGFLVLVFFAGQAFFGVNDDRSTDDLSRYGEYLAFVSSAEQYMPSPEDCGAFQRAELSRRDHIRYIFDFQSVCLFLQYGDGEYDRQKERIEREYRFIEEPDSSFRDVSASFKGYELRAVENDGDWGWPVKRALFIGFNEELHAVVYAYFDDVERDVIDDLADAVKEYFFFPKAWVL